MNQATEIYSREFDSIFFRLPAPLQDRLETRIRQLGRHLEPFHITACRGDPSFACASAITGSSTRLTSGGMNSPSSLSAIGEKSTATDSPPAVAGTDGAYSYTATQTLTAGQNVVIEVTATDRPGHKTTKTQAR